ncbi:hypothetical protein Y032_0069g315 [Ancylostoma ceylanicum]|uniref:Uncharacterized protein n=1 Tax=Ancylostoma ceylanicum TaxID=53326 RepID=A0A016TX60_9BILA|nr:hypothetical protein Y032_0069g315 [Ancylostoma ceylanicum]
MWNFICTVNFSVINYVDYRVIFPCANECGLFHSRVLRRAASFPPLTNDMNQEMDQSATGGAPGPPQDTLNTVLTGHHLDHAQEVRALAILAMVVFGFLAFVAILYAIRWICLLNNNKVHTDGSEFAEVEESSVRLGGVSGDDDKVTSHTDQISDSESAKRCYPSRDKTLELHLPKKKQESEREEGLSEEALKAVPDYSKIVLRVGL